MSEQQMPPIWHSPSEDGYFYKAYRVAWLYIQPIVWEGDLPADARRLHEAVIDETALARAADEVHDRDCFCGARAEHDDELKHGYVVEARLYVEAYLRALGGGSGE
jgi:hypothetical protein